MKPPTLEDMLRNHARVEKRLGSPWHSWYSLVWEIPVESPQAAESIIKTYLASVSPGTPKEDELTKRLDVR